jgi:hypothetical protein
LRATFNRLEFVEQPRFPHPWLGHRRDDLPEPRLCLIGGVLERFHLTLAPDKLCQPATCSPLQTRAQGSEPGHLINVDRLADTSDSGCAQRLENEVALAEPAGFLAHRDRTNRRRRLHPRGEVGGVADWRVFDLTCARLN